MPQPSPLHPAGLLTAVLALARSGELIGVWVRGCRRLLRLRSAGRSLLVGSDLGVLLRRCNRIAIHHRESMLVVEAERLIAWRTLRIVTGATDLPEVEQLRVLIPRLEARGSRIEVPIGLVTPEETLAACVATGVPVVASWITYRD